MDKIESQQHYVRITGTRDNKFVEFEYSIDDPTIFIELILPFEQFDEFCQQRAAVELTPEQSAAVDYDMLKWRYGKPGIAE